MQFTDQLTDNTKLATKLALRTRILEAANLEPLRVLDLCAGEGVIWRQMRQRFKVTSYLPCDQKPRMEACLKMKLDDRHLDAIDPSRFNVVDIDVYGDGFIGFVNLSKRITGKTAFFLTHGVRTSRRGLIGANAGCSKFMRHMNGIPLDWPLLPLNPEAILFMGERIIRKSLQWLTIDRCLVGQFRGIRYYGILATKRVK